MGEVTGISWTDHTFNPWWGCQRVSPECAHCYADTWAKRTGKSLWDTDTFWFPDRWRHPHAWNKQAEANGEPAFVFCASMSDVFQDHPALDAPRERLFELIGDTPWLVWLLLTKRPENIGRMSGWQASGAPDNVWLGTSIGNSRWTRRVHDLTATPAPVHFLSCEPLLDSVYRGGGNRSPLELDDVEWVIVGGESGPNYRPMNVEHAREIMRDCKNRDIPFWFKQHGGKIPTAGGHLLDGVEYYQRPTPVAPLASTLF